MPLEYLIPRREERVLRNANPPALKITGKNVLKLDWRGGYLV